MGFLKSAVLIVHLSLAYNSYSFACKALCFDSTCYMYIVCYIFQIYPRHMLFGHTAAITCIAPGSGQLESTYIVSASENG